ncbi:hypothetical protein niasHT_009377 [Heterodera trifolii]|uniref:RNA helicase n=1 Tax=Heterodera trifolii TaxID=157864 RepID=A0ABD2M3N5_9BILA
MSSGFRGRGRGIAPSQTENGTTHLQNGGLGVISEANLNEGTIIDFSDSQPSQPPIVNVPTKGILRNCNGIDAASDVQKANGTATNEGERQPPISADPSVPFGSTSVPRVASVTGRGTRGVRGGLKRGAPAQNNIIRPPVNAEILPPKSVTFDSTTVFNGSRARGGGGTTNRGFGRGANAIELGSGESRGFGSGATANSILRMMRRALALFCVVVGGAVAVAPIPKVKMVVWAMPGQMSKTTDAEERVTVIVGAMVAEAKETADNVSRVAEAGEDDPNLVKNRQITVSEDHSQMEETNAFRTMSHGRQDTLTKNGPSNAFTKKTFSSVNATWTSVTKTKTWVSLDTMKNSAYETWKDFDLEPKLIDNINRCKYVLPRKIQSYTFPLIRDGATHFADAHAETSSGKSAAFLLPIIDRIMKKEGIFKSRRGCPYALILSPTRELTTQVYEQARKLCDGCDVSVSLTYGGTMRHESIRVISIDGCDILIGTPGRICDFFQTNYLMCDLLKVLVLDEADELRDDKFVLLLRALCNMPNWPTTELRQTLFFTATFSTDVLKWADEFMRPNPVLVSRGKITPNKRIRQTFVLTENAVKRHTLARLLQLEKEQNEQLDRSKKLLSTMVFVNTRNDAEMVCNFLNSRGFSATTIKGRRDQPTRERAVWDFRTGEFQIIVTTDLCARSHDIKNLERVINLDLPCADSAEDAYYKYVQRIGRTGRIQQGMSTTFFDPATDMELAACKVRRPTASSSAGIPQMPNSMPNFDFLPPPPNDLQNGHNNGLPKEQCVEQADDSVDDLFDLVY